MRREQTRSVLDAVDEPVKPNRYLWTFHSLRHVAARYWVFEVKDIHQQPLSLLAVSQHLGHASTASTETVYVGASNELARPGDETYRPGSRECLDMKITAPQSKVGRGADRGHVLLGVYLLGQLSNPDGR